MTNYERVGKAMELLRMGLAPFVERELQALFRGQAQNEALRLVGDEWNLVGKPIRDWDVAALLKLMWVGWDEVFRRVLGQAERNLVAELRNWRNKWAHQEAFSTDDAYRVLDSAARLLSAVAAPQVGELERMKMELLRIRFDEQVRAERRKVGGFLVEAATTALKPWREVVSPHRDVVSGRYVQAEFAADLWQVYLGEASPEYQDPVEFFSRTYLTENLKRLLVNAVQRLSGLGGEPVVQLQTNFGGGKTHAMIALYHLFSGRSPAELPGVEEVMAQAGVRVPPVVRRVVLVGNRISPGNPIKKPDGTEVRTLWGELAWQLGFAAGGLEEAKRAFARVAEDDKNATNPGDTLRELFNAYGPCLILIDEWVAYARQLHDSPDLPGGTFDTQFTFAQALTECARAARNCLVVISLPASDTPTSPHATAEDIEVGGVRGREALERLRNVIGRIESPWRPATAEETFEIVRRRLFEPISDPEQCKARDVVARAFAELYRAHKGAFPAECSEADYERKIKAAYPIHPEVFARLYEDWATLPKFQRTRGVLRLMAAVIHVLWDRGDKNPLILPSTLPLDDPRVQEELARYLSDNWKPVIERDVDGPNSLPVRLDSEVPNFGKYQACRRVARAIFLGSAPLQRAARQGIEDRRVVLGCVMPGESPAIFGDALRKLASEATHLYQDGARYWYSTQPNVTSLAEERAELLAREPEKVVREVERRVREAVKKRPGEFGGVHPFPQSSQEVPDQLDTRLVILGTAYPHTKGEESEALRFAKEILEWRGSAPRLYRNALVFLAPDKARLQDLDEAVRIYLAWGSILAEREQLNLPPDQVRQAEQRRDAADAMIQARLPETFQWLLVPYQSDPCGPVEWKEIRLQGNEGLAERAGRRLLRDELLTVKLAGTTLRHWLDKIPLWRGNHVEVSQLVEDFARYIYLPRLRDPKVLVEAVRDGVALLTWHTDAFAYADSYDELSGRYRGLRAGQQVDIAAQSPTGLVVKPEVARAQLQAEVAKEEGLKAVEETKSEAVLETKGGKINTEAKPSRKLPTRFYGTVSLEPLRTGAAAGRVAEEVIARLASLPKAQVRVTLEIEAIVPDGVPEDIVRIVTENARVLKFENCGFEQE
jgi:predicted AAA+ superfamily ATPase